MKDITLMRRIGRLLEAAAPEDRARVIAYLVARELNVVTCDATERLYAKAADITRTRRLEATAGRRALEVKS